MKTELIIVTDRSGSMATIQADCVGGLKSLLEEQRKVPGECRVTYCQFDHIYDVVLQSTPLESMIACPDLVPRGQTALFDAIGFTLHVQGERIAREKWADLVIVMIVTDGQENSSREYTKDKIKELITAREREGWKFLFLAANQDAFQEASGYGFSAGAGGQTMSMDFCETDVRGVYGASSKSIGNLRSGKTQGDDWKVKKDD